MRSVTLLLSVALAMPLAGQDNERPENWRVRFDRADAQDADLRFETMEPGWHITTGPAGIFYDPARTVDGDFRLESTIFLFDPGRRQREAFGVFLGGRDLDGANQAYVYFLIRNDGRFLIKRRAGSETHTVTDWTEHGGIVRWDGSTTTAENVLAVEASGTEVTFWINGERVASHPGSSIETNGVVGLRVNHALNLHVSSLTVETR